jgi:hypothetical protein
MAGVYGRNMIISLLTSPLAAARLNFRDLITISRLDLELIVQGLGVEEELMENDHVYSSAGHSLGL